jgi:fido (protein-threonine AMPylation protein)
MGMIGARTADLSDVPMLELAEKKAINTKSTSFLAECYYLLSCPLEELEPRFVQILGQLQRLGEEFSDRRSPDHFHINKFMFDIFADVVRMSELDNKTYTPRQIALYDLVIRYFAMIEQLGRNVYRFTHELEHDWDTLLGRSVSVRNEKRTENYERLKSWLNVMAKEIPPLNAGLIIALRNMVMQDLMPPVGFRTSGEKVAFGLAEGCPAEQLLEAMNEYIRWLNQELVRVAPLRESVRGWLEIPVVIARAMKRFIEIHPFIKGNGRAAFALAALLNTWAGYGVPNAMRFDRHTFSESLLQRNPVAIGILGLSYRKRWQGSRAWSTA